MALSIPLSPQHDMNALIGTHDLVFITFDTLRYDVAQQALQQGMTPVLASLLPDGGWEKRQTSATFTYAAHQAFFAGFWPVPIPKPVPYQRRFACQFSGSETTGNGTWTTPAASIIQGLQQVGYHTICIGGVGFFNPANALGTVLPSLFMENHWSTGMSVTSPTSTAQQVALACERLAALPRTQRVLLFVNISALHQPNCLFTAGATADSVHTQMNALAYVDRQLPPLLAALQQRGTSFCLLCADHGTAYGEDGVWGHGVAHPVVWEVPYTEFCLPALEHA